MSSYSRVPAFQHNHTLSAPSELPLKSVSSIVIIMVSRTLIKHSTSQQPVPHKCEHFKVMVGHKNYIPQKYDHRDLANKMLDFIFQGMHFIQPSKAVSPLSRSD